MSKAISRDLDRDGMNLPTKLLFTVIFLSMGLSIVGAGLKGAPSTAPIVILIGFMMVTIGFAPFIVPLLYKFYVDPKREVEAEVTKIDAEPTT